MWVSITIRLVLLVVALKLSVFCSMDAIAAENVRVGVPSRSALWWPLYVAEDRQLYQAEGIAVETVLIQAGAARAMQILTAGDLDFVTAGTISSLGAYLRGSQIVMVAGLIDKSPFQIFATPDIQSIKDLRGKAIASGALGGPPHFVMSVVLRAAGLDPRKDVQQFNVAGGNNRILALQQKQVSAAVLPPPFSFRAAEMGFKRIASARDYIPDDQNDGISTMRDIVEKQPEKVRKFVRAVTKGMRFIVSNRGEAIRILGKYTQATRPMLEKTYEFMVPTINEKINEGGVESIYQYLVESGVVKEGREWKGFIDLRFLPHDL
jgi:ABC-type nitrate/sulfonate/bicarbonate transport system substrate-binding protein